MSDRTPNADLRPIIMRLVPRSWTAEQAFQAIALLQQAIAAIWLVHGEKLGKSLFPEGTAEPPAPPASPKPDARRGPQKA